MQMRLRYIHIILTYWKKYRDEKNVFVLSHGHVIYSQTGIKLVLSVRVVFVNDNTKSIISGVGKLIWGTSDCYYGGGNLVYAVRFM